MQPSINIKPVLNHQQNKKGGVKQNINFIGGDMQQHLSNMPFTLNYDSNRDHLHD
jgi:hypothetical protein